MNIKAAFQEAIESNDIQAKGDIPEKLKKLVCKKSAHLMLEDKFLFDPKMVEKESKMTMLRII